MKSRTNLGGFTLIEMMITVVIIGIIAAMAAPSFKAQIAERKIEDDMHKVEICFKESQLLSFMYKVPITVSLNGSSSMLTCGNSAPIKLSSGVKLNSGVNESIVFRPDRMVYTTNTQSNSTTTLSDTNGGYTFCITGYPEHTLQLNSRGMVTTTKGTTICN